MNPVAGHVMDVTVKEGKKIARVQLRTTVVSVTVAPALEVAVGDTLLVDAGVAVAKIQNRREEEE